MMSLRHFPRVLRHIIDHPLNRGRRCAALRRFLNWQLVSRLAPGAIAFDWIEGSRLLVRKGDVGITGNIYCGLHDFEAMSFLMHLLRPGDCFADIGANAGVWTVLAAAVVGAETWAFEPAPATYRRLMDNIRLNDLGGLVHAFNAAVGEKPGTLRFTVGMDCVNHVVTTSEQVDSVTVETVVLNEVFADTLPQMMKIDVEGFETPVLNGATRLLAHDHLKAIVIELIGNGNRYGYDEGAIVKMLGNHGFQPCQYDPWTRQLSSFQLSMPVTGNPLFVRDKDWVESRLRTSKDYVVYGLHL